MKTDDLLTRYFDGETTCAEERELKRLFKEEPVPPGLEVYRPLFAFFDEEAGRQPAHGKERETVQPQALKAIKPKRTFVYALSGIAAGLLILLGIAGIKQINRQAGYVIVDGHKSTDIHLIRQQAKAAFDDVSFSREDIFETLFNE